MAVRSRPGLTVRILQLHNDHASLGGAPEVMAHEADLLRTAGHEVEQYRLAAAEQLGLNPARAAAKAIWNVEATRHVARIIQRFGPDVVHVHTPFPLMSPAVFRTAKAHGIPTVTTLHSYRWSCIAATCFRDGHVCEDCVGSRLKLPGVRHRCYHDSLAGSTALTAGLLLHRTLGTQQHKVDRWIALTAFGKRLLVRDGVPEHKVTVKPNSMADPGQPAGPTDPPYVAFAGRLVDVKGVRTLLRAWSSLAGGRPAGQLAGRPQLTLKIAGDGALRADVEQAAAADPSIEYLGWVGEDEVARLTAGARAMLVPSEWYEGLPLVVVRSLSYGTPLVVSDLENICEDILTDDTGVAFATGDAAGLARVLRSVLSEVAAWDARRPRARASYLARYTPAVDLARLEQIYAEVVAG